MLMGCADGREMPGEGRDLQRAGMSREVGHDRAGCGRHGGETLVTAPVGEPAPVAIVSATGVRGPSLAGIVARLLGEVLERGRELVRARRLGRYRKGDAIPGHQCPFLSFLTFDNQRLPKVSMPDLF